MWKLDEPRMAVEPKSDPLRIEASSREGFWEVMPTHFEGNVTKLAPREACK
jgi:hypothetical protein